MSAGARPARRGTVVATPAPDAWQPEHEAAPGGAAGAATAAGGDAAGAARSSRTDHAPARSWFISGNERMRLPVAAKTALITAGAATPMVGSPTPPQKPPDGINIAST